MQIIKKLNNNFALALDSAGKEIIANGKGIGFEKMPYELTDLSKLDRTYYDIDEKYYNILKDIPEDVFLYVSKLLEAAQKKVNEKWNPNLAFILSDHVNFAIMRNRKNMNISLPYSYELEYENPELCEIAHWFLKNINNKFNTTLERGEVTSIMMHMLSAKYDNASQKSNEEQDVQIDRIIQRVTQIVENFFDLKIKKNSFYYFRFKNHIKFLVKRKHEGSEFSDSQEELYKSLLSQQPEIAKCVREVHEYLKTEFSSDCTDDELMYLMIHIHQLYSKEDCNQ